VEQIKQSVKSYILENVLYGAGEDALSYEDSFLEKGLIDSTGIMEIVIFIEEEYGFSIYDEELIPENLDSINNLSRFINRKREGNLK
jgi:acyl carrier protein